MKRLGLCWVLALFAAGFAPPPTLVQQLVADADEARRDAARLDARGERPRAAQGYRKAIELYQKALAADADHLPAAVGLGIACNAARDYALAVKVLEPFHSAHPEAMGVTFQLGQALFKLKRHADALPLLEAVAQAGAPDQFMAYYYLGQHALAEDNGTRAVDALTRYLATRPDQLKAGDPDVHELIGRAFLAQRKPAQARAAFAEALRGRPGALGPQLGLAAALELEGRRGEAIALLDALIQKHPRAPEVRERLGRLLLLAGDHKRAESVVVALLSMQPSTGAHVLLGEIRLASKQLPGAEAEFRAALKLAPDTPAAVVGLSRALALAGRPDQAIEALERAAAAHPEELPLQAALGSAYRRTGQYQRAIEVHHRVLQMAPRSALGHRLIGADHFATGQWEAAIEDYAAALKLEPEDAQARHWLALALAHRAQLRAGMNVLDDAARDLRRAFDLERSADLGRMLAVTLLAGGQYAEARAVLQRATALKDAGWREHLLLGYAFLGSGSPKEALAAFERAGKLTKDDRAQADVYAGWSLAKIELGDYSSAVGKLETLGGTRTPTQVTRSNLALALLHRALERLEQGDVAGAAKDADGARELVAARAGAAAKIAELARALVLLEKNQFAEASSGVRKALAGREPWAESATRPLLDAFVEYRRGRLPEARKLLASATRHSAARTLPWAAALAHALSRREGEQAYGQGQLKRAEQALKAAAAADPLNPYVVHNLACLKYRAGDTAAAVASWQSVLETVPEAALNLGIHAHEHEHDARRAVELYGRYVAAGGTRAATVREWIDRLARIHGFETSPASAGGRGTP